MAVTRAEPVALSTSTRQQVTPFRFSPGSTSRTSSCSQVAARWARRLHQPRVRLRRPGKHISISWYTAGTRYLEINDRTGATIGDKSAGTIKEAGWFIPEGGSTRSSKIYKNPKYIFSNDINRGFDIYKVTGK